MKDLNWKEEAQQWGLVVLGSLLFGFGVNLFITPLDLYNGGAVGVAQLLDLFVRKGLGVHAGGLNLYGVIYFLLNIPLVLVAYKSLGKKFLGKTIVSTIVLSVGMGMIPIPKTAILDDYLASALIGGLVAGVGIGIVLRAGGSGGGLDVLGVYFSKKYKKFSVGRLSLFVNIALYGICFFIFDVRIVIYSIIYTAVMAFCMDKVHAQNINVSLMVFTKKKGVEEAIMNQTGRGVTRWQGEGAYTSDETTVFVTIVNKYEIHLIKGIVKEIDPQAFMIANEGIDVDGNFEKRL